MWSKHCPVLLICSKMKYPPTQRSQRVSYYTDTCSCSSSIVMDTESASKYLKGCRSLSDVIMLTIELASEDLERWTVTGVRLEQVSQPCDRCQHTHVLFSRPLLSLYSGDNPRREFFLLPICFPSQDPVTGVSTYTDPQDGVVYELDPVKNAW